MADEPSRTAALALVRTLGRQSPCLLAAVSFAVLALGSLLLGQLGVAAAFATFATAQAIAYAVHRVRGEPSDAAPPGLEGR